MNVDLSKILNISARVSFALAIACSIILFVPAGILPFDVSAFRNKNGVWIFIIFAFSIAIILSFAGQWLFSKFSDIITKKKVWKNYEYILANLSEAEKQLLHCHFIKDEPTLYFNPTNPVHKHLETLGVISMSPGVSIGHSTAFPGFIQPWVFKLIKKNPDILD